MDDLSIISGNDTVVVHSNENGYCSSQSMELLDGQS